MEILYFLICLIFVSSSSFASPYAASYTKITDENRAAIQTEVLDLQSAHNYFVANDSHINRTFYVKMKICVTDRLVKCKDKNVTITLAPGQNWNRIETIDFRFAFDMPGYRLVTAETEVIGADNATHTVDNKYIWVKYLNSR